MGSTVTEEVKDFLNNRIWAISSTGSKNVLPLSYQHEFRSTHIEDLKYKMQCHYNVFKLKSQYCWKHAFSPRSLSGLATSAVGIFGIGCFEAYLLTKGKKWSPQFFLNYAKHQMFPSIIWATKPAETVLMSMGKNSSHYLRDFSVNTTETARLRLQILGAQTFRSILAGFLGISQIFQIVFAFDEANMEYEKKLKEGRIGLVGDKPKIIRFCGKSSDVSELSISRFGSRFFLPIFEDPKKVKDLVKLYSDATTIPVFWCVENEKYGSSFSWGVCPFKNNHRASMEGAKFQINYNWLHSIKNSKSRVFILEGDSSVGEQSLALAEESSNDLNIWEASLGFRSLTKLAIAQNALNPKLDRVVKVLLIDQSQPVFNGGGSQVSLREHIVSNNIADIIIDAKNPLLKAITTWANQAYAEMGQPNKKKIYFDTCNRDYFETVKRNLGRAGWHVLEGKSNAQEFNTKEHYDAIPCLVYQNSTSQTVDSIRSLISAQGVSTLSVCALLDKHEGATELEQLQYELELSTSIGYVCSSSLYDLLFQSVRLLVKEGMPVENIQKIVDESVLSL